VTAANHQAPGWRPAPFAVHGPDRCRLLLEHALALCCLIVFVAALLPQPAGREGALLLPVGYQCVELPERAPALIAVNLPVGDYTIEPESLGYFAKPGEFVYTAAVARGVIYGRAGGRLTVLEVAAPQDAQAFIQQHLEKIRAAVVEQNKQENFLANARAEFAKADARLDREVAQQYRKLGSRASAATVAQASALAQRAKADEAEAASALDRLAARQVRLKQLYYECQRSRLVVTGHKAALQLALAHLPEPRFNELLSLGDQTLVRATVKVELDNLETAWRAHLREVRQELAQAPAAAYSVTPPVAEERLAQALRAARRQELSTEAVELERSLAQLVQLRRQLSRGEPPAWTELPRLEFKPQQLARPSLAALPGFSTVLGLAGEPGPTLALLRQLARRFEGWPLIEDEHQAQIANQGYPFELPYGLLAVDLAVRQQGRLAQGNLEQPEAEQEMTAGLQAMLTFPDSYGLAAMDLSYLRCLAWYAQQARTAQAMGGG
jgi:hypothetical protein